MPCEYEACILWNLLLIRLKRSGKELLITDQRPGPKDLICSHGAGWIPLERWKKNN